MKEQRMFGSQKTSGAGIVALFNASDDTVDMVQKLLTDADEGQTLIWCHFADLKKGIVNFDKVRRETQPGSRDLRYLPAV
jgi:hypothetical protein